MTSLHDIIRGVVGLAIAVLTLGVAGAADHPMLLLRADDTPLRTGTYSIFAVFQDHLAHKLNDCGKSEASAALALERSNGRFGSGSAAALRAAHACGLITNSNGVLTEDVWRSITGDVAVPRLQERSDVIILTFEATDFGQPPEWNLCQDGFELRNDGQLPLCVNRTDPCSFLTWGPRGATAGQGREIQWILTRILRDDPALLAAAFAGEFENLQRFLKLAAPPPEDCEGTTPLEHFMCALWLDETRRAIWNQALTRLGRESSVRAAFQAVYALEAFDGYKMRAYYELWHILDISPSEIDYAFFLDRATQIGAPPTEIQSRMRTCMQSQTAALNRNAAARRCLADLHPHPTLPVDRLARDVAFYHESFAPASLTDLELRLWQNHIPVSAQANFGLSDDKLVPLEQVLSSTVTEAVPEFTSTFLTETESSCPASILRSIRTTAPAAR